MEAVEAKPAHVPSMELGSKHSNERVGCLSEVDSSELGPLSAASAKLDHGHYQVGWVCAIPTEKTAAALFLDEEYGQPEKLAEHDNNAYTLGRMGRHRVVIAVLPAGEYGLEAAASLASNMLRSFPNIKIGLMVGIAGGVPSSKHDIRLGDIVVSEPQNGHGGVFQYDYGKSVQDGHFINTRFLNQPPTILRTRVSDLKSRYEINGHQLLERIDRVLEKRPRLHKKYKRPDQSIDRLYRRGVVHKDEESPCVDVCGVDESRLVSRTHRTDDEDDPAVHYGLIASGNSVVKNAITRDELAAAKDVLCFEMEAAGLMNHFPCMVIRGICDYSDSHKNKDWQGYAAMTAAAYARDLLDHIPPGSVEGQQPLLDLVSGVASNVSEITQGHRDEAKEKILTWLSPVDYAPQQNDFLQQRSQSTGEWFFDTKEFQNWVHGDGDRTLFCPGIPGAGKTILTATVIDHLRHEFAGDDTACIVYIYCNFRRQEEQTAAKMLANILKQLGDQYRGPIHQALTELYKKHQEHRTTPSIGELLTTCISLSASCSKFFIVVDALDECSRAPREELLVHIRSLLDRTKAYLLATSRYLPEVKELFTDKPHLDIRADATDVWRYVLSRMSDLSFCVQDNSVLQKEIATAIAEATSGMFLLARIYVGLLSDRMSVNDIRASLRDFRSHAPGADENQNTVALKYAYDEAMQRIDRQQDGRKALAHKVLVWITRACRPLTAIELQHALAVRDGSEDIDEDDFIPLQEMVSTCAGLTVMDEESEVIRLVHYTTQDYLEHRWSEQSSDQHLGILRACACYLSFKEFQLGASQGVTAIMARLERYPFYDYACHFWGFHLDRSNGLELPEQKLEFLTNSSLVEAVWEVVHFKETRFCSSSIQHDFTDGMVLAIGLAARLGAITAVEMLLDWGADIEGAEYPYGTPLSLAVRYRREVVIRLLLDRGAAIEAKHLFETPLIIAVDTGQAAVAQLLLERGAAIEAVDDRFLQTPLSWSATKGHEEMTRLLLDSGAAINATDVGGQTALTSASRFDRVDVVRLLLDRGAAIDTADEDGRTPLIWASMKGQEDVLRLLLDRGAAIDTADKDGRTPLIWASISGEEDIVRLLLDRGAAIDTADTEGRTPLFWASEQGQEEVNRVMLNYRATIDVLGRKDWWNLGIRSQPVARLLVDRGARRPA